MNIEDGTIDSKQKNKMVKELLEKYERNLNNKSDINFLSEYAENCDCQLYSSICKKRNDEYRKENQLQAHRDQACYRDE